MHTTTRIKSLASGVQLYSLFIRYITGDTEQFITPFRTAWTAVGIRIRLVDHSPISGTQEPIDTRYIPYTSILYYDEKDYVNDISTTDGRKEETPTDQIG